MTMFELIRTLLTLIRSLLTLLLIGTRGHDDVGVAAREHFVQNRSHTRSGQVPMLYNSNNYNIILLLSTFCQNRSHTRSGQARLEPGLPPIYCNILLLFFITTLYYCYFLLLPIYLFLLYFIVIIRLWAGST